MEKMENLGASADLPIMAHGENPRDGQGEQREWTRYLHSYVQRRKKGRRGSSESKLDAENDQEKFGMLNLAGDQCLFILLSLTRPMLSAWSFFLLACSLLTDLDELNAPKVLHSILLQWGGEARKTFEH